MPTDVSIADLIEYERQGYTLRKVLFKLNAMNHDGTLTKAVLAATEGDILVHCSSHGKFRTHSGRCPRCALEQRRAWDGWRGQ